MTDIRVENHGSIYIFIPQTDDGREWVDANLSLESWQWFGPGFAVEPRYALQLAEGMLNDGLRVH